MDHPRCRGRSHRLQTSTSIIAEVVAEVEVDAEINDEEEEDGDGESALVGFFIVVVFVVTTKKRGSTGLTVSTNCCLLCLSQQWSDLWKRQPGHVHTRPEPPVID